MLVLMVSLCLYWQIANGNLKAAYFNYSFQICINYVYYQYMFFAVSKRLAQVKMITKSCKRIYLAAKKCNKTTVNNLK